VGPGALSLKVLRQLSVITAYCSLLTENAQVFYLLILAQKSRLNQLDIVTCRHRCL
jgi:hypothetical protein